jgi:tight adherence protein B
MTASPVMLMALLSTALMAVGGGLLAGDRRERERRVRIASVLSNYAPTAATQTSATGIGSAEQLLRSQTINRVAAFLRIEPSRLDLYPAPWWLMLSGLSIVVLGVTGLATLMIGPVAWFAFPIGWVWLTRTMFAGFVTRRAAILYSQLPDALGMIVRSVRAGLPVTEALRVVAEESQPPTSLEFGQLYDQLRLGGSLPDALTKLAQRNSLLEYRFFAVSLSLQSQSGGSLTETLDNLADLIRKRVALKQRAIALASEARMTMYVLAVLPFIAGGALIVVSPAYVSQLVYTATGRKLLFVGIALLTLGFVSMRVIIRRSVS